MPGEENRPGVAPYALAMVICDTIYKDPSTGKRSLMGCFSVIGARRFPAIHPRIALYVALTDGRGTVPIRLRLVDAEEASDPLVEAEAEISFEDPRVVVEMDYTFQNCEFPAPGEYRFQLFGKDEPLLERRVILHQIGGG